MIEKKEVEHLAELSRIKLSDTEIKKFQDDLGSILDYVDQVKEAVTKIDSAPKVGLVHNVLREDKDPHNRGENREEIIESFPKKEGSHLKVKKILQ